jgi:hypothetical protein
MLARYAEKYDGNPNVSVIDVRSIGVWGEGHMGDSGVTATREAIKAHIDMYPKYFKKTPIVLQDDTPGFNDWAGAYAAALGYGMRDDSLPGDDNNTMWWSPNDYAEAEPFWRNAPVVLETFHMWEAYPRGEWISGETFLESMETWHASYLSIHHHARPFALAFPEFMERANRRLGYRLTPLEIGWVEHTAARGRVNMTFKWQNGGTAPFYKGGYPAVTLRDKDGGIMGVFVDTAFNLRDLEVGPPDAIPSVTRQFDLRLPNVLPGGEYDLYLSVGDIDGTPRVQMPIADTQPADRRYHIGKLNVKGDYDAKLLRVDGAGEVVTAVLEISGHTEIPVTNRPVLEFYNNDAPKFGDQENWLVGFDANAFESDWNAGKRAELNENGVTTVTMKVRIGRHHYGKTYKMNFGMEGNDEEIIQGDQGRYTAVGLLRVSETGEISLAGEE